VSPELDVELDRDCYAPGDAVRGTIYVVEGGRSRSLEILLEYWEKTDDYSAVAISISGPPVHVGDLTTGTSFEFELRLPPDALPNYVSEHGELYWELDVKSDERGLDTHEQRRIDVVPAHAKPAAERDDAEDAFELGVELEGRGDIDGALAAYRRADERGHADGAANLGTLLEDRGDVQGAELAYRRADERGSAAGANNLGVLLEDRGELEAAEAAYRRADERGGPEGAENLGRLLEERGDLEGAEAAYGRAEERRRAEEE
jgi:tetratricopeptide (TPR) repeat protein